jgi:dTDP-glucose 4,6-dehydratase
MYSIPMTSGEKFMNSSIMVTGGAGFIGSDFVRLVDSIQEFQKIFVVDSFTYASDIRRIANVSQRVEIIESDITDTHLYKSAIRECDFVVNFAAESHVDRSISSGKAFIDSNILGSFNLFESCREDGAIKVIHVSTDEVYGSIAEGESVETDVLSPSSSYSASKASSDLLALANFKTHGQKILVTRCTNNFGLFQHSEKFLPTVINCILQNKPIPIYGNGSNQREWIHVSDHNRAILSLLENFNPGEIYNIGSGFRISNFELAEYVIEIIGASRNLLTFIEDRKGHDLRYALNSSKIAASHGWRPLSNFDQGLKATVEWYTDWYQKHGEIYS